ncbi:ATP-binding cassette domain-containing protein [Glaciihabitans sp. dw_435]|uniref:ATP-binding cassette domain-containing protein n=1 Tax=Glaciihabitans sp. dw_435 TaxID=2720081 RepID=UPI001BD3C15F|nr:ATP-binding cassette domain-containing protein [Glaciihabitans sp. dw_435]
MVTQPDGQGTQLAIRARSLKLVDRRTTVFDGIDIALPVGEMLVLTGVGGAGKTSLLLALAGRLKPTAGQLTVLGLDLPAKAGAVRRRVAFTGNATVAALDDNLTVRQHIAEAIVLSGPWWKTWTTRREVADVIDRANAIISEMSAVGASTESTPGQRSRLEPLNRDQFVAVVGPLPRLVLSVVLALISVPDMLVIDDVDALRDLRDRKLAWTSLATIRTPKTQNLTIVATCQDAGELPSALMEAHDSTPPGEPGTFVRRVSLLPVGDAPRSLHGAASNGTLHVGSSDISTPDTTDRAALAAEAN